MCLTSVLVLVPGSIMMYRAIRDYSWLIQPKMQFNEAWSSEERVALAQLEHEMRFCNSDLVCRLDTEDNNFLECSNEWEFYRLGDAKMAHYGSMLEHRLRTVVAAGTCAADSVDPTVSESHRRIGSLAMVAAMLGHSDAVRALVRHGANLETIASQNEENDTSLLSIVLQYGDLELADWLIEQGATVSPGYPLDLCWDVSPSVTCWLIAHGLTVGGVDQEGRSNLAACLNPVNLRLITEWVENGTLDIHNPSPPSNLSVLFFVLDTEKLPLFKLLLELGADPNTHDGTRSILSAVLESFLHDPDAIFLEDRLAMVRLLLVHGAIPEKAPEGLDSTSLERLRNIYKAYGNTLEISPKHPSVIQK